MAKFKEQTQIGEDVLTFYRSLPFNVSADPASVAERIREENQTAQYPPLMRLAYPGRRVLDAGCGGGWLTNTLAYHQKVDAVGIDFNPVAIDFARQVARTLGIDPIFEVADLFKFTARPFDLVVSVGVLHHTADSLGAILRLGRNLVRPGGFLFVGLYHAHGRRPFLDHFRGMKEQGFDEDALIERFEALFGDQAMDKVHLNSWFRDQVLHPHETQHTLAELLPVLDQAGLTFLASSLNDYRLDESIESLLAREIELEAIGRERLASGSYYPGFFTFLARKSK